jgi:outer membrane protein assembly factor BamB
MTKQAAIALAALVVAAGCSTYNPLKAVGIISDPPNPPTPLTAFKPLVEARAAWTATVGKARGFKLEPAVLEGRVYAISADGNFTVLDEANGRVAASVPSKE